MQLLRNDGINHLKNLGKLNLQNTETTKSWNILISTGKCRELSRENNNLSDLKLFPSNSLQARYFFNFICHLLICLNDPAKVYSADDKWHR